jgi:Ca-activated chloride channel homolog
MIDSFQLASPERLWIGVGSVAIVAVVLIASRARIRSLADLCEAFLKTAVLMVLSLAISGAYIVSRATNASTLALVDVSASISDELGERMLQELAESVLPQSKVDVVPFAASVGEKIPYKGQKFSSLRSLLAKPTKDSTNLEAALGFLRSSGTKTAYLLSDGNETVGIAERELPLLVRDNVVVTPVIVDGETSQKDAVLIEQIDAPLLVPSAERAGIRVVMRNRTGNDSSGSLVVKQAGKEVARTLVTLGAHERQVVEVDSAEILPGAQEIVAEYIAEGSQQASPQKQIIINGQQKEKVLLISGASEDSRYFRELLTRRSFQLETVEANGTTLAELPALKDFSVIVLNNIASKHLPLGANSLLEEYVSNGGSLLMTGGNSSFGLGGYKDTPIAKALPVVVEDPKPETKRLNVAVQLVMDKSGSMKQGSKIVFARLAAQQVVKNLKDQDYFGLIAFDDFPFVVQPMGMLASIRERAFRAPEDLMHPTGTTNLFPALDMGLKALARAQAGRKHLIILTDGKIPDGGSHGDLYMKVVGDARSDYGITVSTFLIGADSDSLLRELASKGGGAFHQTQNIQALPSLFMQDITVNTGDKTQREADQLDVRAELALKASTLKSYPPLKGFIQTSAKQTADVQLSVFGGSKPSPLLVSWNYGKGKSLAYTSDVNGRWSQHWVTWARNQQFWVEVLDSIRPISSDPDANLFDLTKYAEGSELKLDLQLYQDARKAVTAELVSPSGKVQNLVFEAVARGRLLAGVKNPELGAYRIRTKVGDTALAEVSFYNYKVSVEAKDQGVNLSLLNKIAARTGSTLSGSIQFVKETSKDIEKRQDISTALCAAALLLWLLSLIWRERRVVRLLIRRITMIGL